MPENQKNFFNFLHFIANVSLAIGIYDFTNLINLVGSTSIPTMIYIIPGLTCYYMQKQRPTETSI